MEVTGKGVLQSPVCAIFKCTFIPCPSNTRLDIGSVSMVDDGLNVVAS